MKVTFFYAGTPTEGKYKFDTYRVSYRYLFFNELPRRKQRGITEGSDRYNVASNGVLDPMLRNKNAWRMHVGATLLVRDAKIEREQAGLNASDSNVGVAPLLNFSIEWAFARRWAAIFDFEGLAGGPGRALSLRK